MSNVEAGFLQEANRQWFHPHGLALELTIIREGEDAPLTRVSLSPAQLETLKALLFMEQSIPHYKPENAALEPKAVEALGDAIDKAITYGVGDCYFSGCWDGLLRESADNYEALLAPHCVHGYDVADASHECVPGSPARLVR
jgi:hypothetical protein